MTTSRKPTDAPPDASASGQDNVWLAGLGAWAQAQARGTEAFDALVREGMAQQTKAREAAEAELSKAAERISALTSTATTTPWDRLGGIFETRVGHALERIGMPAPDVLQHLLERVEALEQRLAQLEQGQPSPPDTAPAAPQGRRPRAPR